MLAPIAHGALNAGLQRRLLPPGSSQHKRRWVIGSMDVKALREGWIELEKFGLAFRPTSPQIFSQTTSLTGTNLNQH